MYKKHCHSHCLSNDVGVTSVGDGENGGTEVLTAGGTEVEVVTGVLVDRGVGEHGVVLNLGATDGGKVGGEDNELGATLTDGLEGLGVAEAVLAGLHDKLELVVDGVGLRLKLLSGHCELTFSKDLKKILKAL